MAATTVPQFALPLTIDPATGSFATVEQDSIDDIAQCVTAILATPPGTRWDVPDFGIPDPLFQVGLDTTEVQGQLAKYEPRAQTSIDQTAGDDLSLAVAVRVEALRTASGESSL